MDNIFVIFSSKHIDFITNRTFPSFFVRIKFTILQGEILKNIRKLFKIENKKKKRKGVGEYYFSVLLKQLD